MPTNQSSTKYQKIFYLFLMGLLVLPIMVSGESFIQQEKNDKTEINIIIQPRGSHDIASISNTTFGFPGTSEYGNAICGDENGLYAIGYYYNEASAKMILLATKWDHDLKLIWNRTVEWSDYLQGQDIALIDGNLYLTGYAMNYTSHEYPIFLSKWDIQGNPLETHYLTYPDASSPTIEHLEFHDGLLYTCGSFWNISTFDSDLLLICWDLAGNVLWNRTWGYNLEDGAFDLWINSNALYTCGKTLSIGEGGSDLLLIKWDHEGNEIWNRTWGTTIDEFGGGIWGTADAIYTTGSMYNASAAKIRFALVKWDLMGNVLWNITLPEGVNSDGKDIWGIDDNHIYAIGDYVVPGMRDQILLMQLNSDGNYSITLYGGSNYDFAYEMFGGYPYLYVIGATRSYGMGGFDFFLVKFKIISDLTAPILQPITPNPNSNGKVSFTWTEVEGATSYDVYQSTENITSFLSEKLLIGSFTSLSCTNENLADGTYYYSILARNATEFSDLSNCVSVQVSIQKKISGFKTISLIVFCSIFIISLILKKKMRHH